MALMVSLIPSVVVMVGSVLLDHHRTKAKKKTDSTGKEAGNVSISFDLSFVPLSINEQQAGFGVSIVLFFFVAGG